MTDIDEILRDYSEEWRDRQPPVDVDFGALPAPRRGPRRVVMVLAAAAVAALVAVAVFVQPSSGPQHVQVVSPTTNAKTNPIGIIPRVARTFDLGPEEQYPAAVSIAPAVVSVLAQPLGGGNAWVTNIYVGQNDPGGAVLSQVRLPDDGPIALVGDASAQWVSSQVGEQSAHVYRIQNGAITAKLTTQGDAQLALTDTALWVLDGKGELLRVDPRTAHVNARLALPGAGYAPKFISVGPLGVWLASPYDGSIWRVAPDDRTLQRVASVGSYAGRLSQLASRIWVATTQQIAAVDPKTGHTTQTIDLHARIIDLTNDGHYLWVATDGPRLYRIDPTGHTATVALPAAGPILALAGDANTRTVWAVTAGTQSGAGLCHTAANDCPKLLHVTS